MPTLHFMLPGDPASATGGYEYDRQVIAGLRRLGWRVHLHCLDGSFPRPSPAALEDARRRLANLPDDAWVLIDGLALGAMPAVVREQQQRLKLMALVHHPLADETGLTADQAEAAFSAEREALQSVRCVVTTGPAMQQALQRYVSDPQRIGMAPPGVRRPTLVGMRGQSTGATVRLLCVATVTPRKGHALLIEALAALRHLPWELECVGDTARSPDTFRTLQQRIFAAGLQSRVRFTGVLDDEALESHWSAADVFVLATHFEGYGMAVADALTRGVPVVSTRTGEIESLVGAGGWLVMPGDEAGLRDALSAVITDAALRQRLAAAAAEQGAALPDWDAASRQLSALLIQGSQWSVVGETA